MTQDFRDAVKLPGVEASHDEQQLYSVQIAVQGLIDFVVKSFEELGIEKLHELTNPSLDEILDIILKLDDKAKELGDTDLQQVLLTAQILVKDIKRKDPEFCAQTSKLLKRAVIFK